MNNKKIYTVIILIAIVFTQSSYAQNNQITAVDLGLSIMWADRNLGAAFPEEYGNYYAWGEIATKSVFSWDTYYGSDNFREHLDKTEDVASVKLSDHWRMPTLEEIEELTKNCYFYKTTLKGVNVILVTSKINGKRIILPEAGYYDGSDRGQEFRTGVAIWSSSMNRGVPARSFTLRVYKVANDLVASYMDSPRCNGLPIRPVREKQGATLQVSEDTSRFSLIGKTYNGGGNSDGMAIDMTINFLTDNKCVCLSDWYRAYYPDMKKIDGTYEIKGEKVIVRCKDGDIEYKFAFDVKNEGRVLEFNNSDHEKGRTMSNDYMSLNLK